ncbi:MAG: CRISPR-associated helicase Cas3' [Phycisphaerae bacterium]
MSESKRCYAHSYADLPEERWQLLADHLTAVSRLAAQFANRAFPNDPYLRDTVAWAGLLHDLGKYRCEFQRMIRGGPRTEQSRHKQAGAAFAAERRRKDLAFVIAGHHGGLPDQADLKEMIAAPGGRDVLSEVLRRAMVDCPALNAQLPAWDRSATPLDLNLFIRLCFACLVDADWSDTTDAERRAHGFAGEPPPPDLNPGEALKRALEYIEQRARACSNERVARLRRQVLDAALRSAREQPGLFSMTVPTGGGKTLAALAFALAHAREHALRRIIYVAPYLTIIEQNAREIRRALQAENECDTVLEHHSLAEPGGQLDGDEAQSSEAARQAENWGAPVIVTTNVQFYESLFSNLPGQCRKLHNIARSVIILDECQTLPPGLVAPTCAMLEQLTRLAGCSIVLCTATQPAWQKRADLPEGLSNVREIVPPDLHLFERLRRVRVRWPKQDEPAMEWSEVAARMLEHRAALCVVNTRAAARSVLEQLRQAGAEHPLHLSTYMCPAHRLEVIDEVRRRLTVGAPCHLVSTQLIEAGVDLDFPFLMREMAPLEAVVQASGRCNREGLLNRDDGTPGGEVVVFRSRDGGTPRDAWYEAGISKVEQSFLAMGREPDIGRPEDIDEYFRRLYRSGELDEHHIREDRENFRFATAAAKYRIVRPDEATRTVVVATWEPAREQVAGILDKLHVRKPKALYRKLSRFQVNLREREFTRAGGLVAPAPGGILVWWGPYDPASGLVLDGNIELPPI